MVYRTTSGLTLLLLASMITSGCSGCVRRTQEKALLLYSLGMCESQEHESGGNCRSDVELRFPRCAPSFLADEVGMAGFLGCVGFLHPPTAPEPVLLGECDGTTLAMEYSLALAKGAPFESSTSRVIDGWTLYVANTPTITTADVEYLRLEDQEFGRFAVLEISEEAAVRLEATTRANVGGSMVMSLNGTVTVPTVATPLAGRELQLTAPDARIEDFCRAP